MRILVATSDYPPAIGGMAEFSDAWARGLEAGGMDIFVLARRLGLVPEGKKPIISAEWVSWTGPDFAYPIAAYRNLSRAVTRRKPDLVFAHTWVGWAPALAYLKGRRGTRYIVAAHGAEILGPAQSRYYRALMKIGLKAADRILAVSRFTGEAIADLGISWERIAVIGNGVDVDRFKPGPRDFELVRKFGLNGKRVITTVGGLVDRKGHDIVIEAMALLREKYPDLVYLIAGGWALRSSRETDLRKRVAHLGLDDQVVFTGYLHDEVLPEIYRLADVFAMPGREVREKGWVEGFGISYLEAAATGIPIVATNAGGASEAVSPDNALMVPAEDPRATADAIAKILDDAALRDRMARAGRDWARKNSWSSRIAMGLDMIRNL